MLQTHELLTIYRIGFTHLQPFPYEFWIDEMGHELHTLPLKYIVLFVHVIVLLSFQVALATLPIVHPVPLLF